MFDLEERVASAGIKRHLWVFLCLAIVVTLIYSNSFDASFHLDDRNIIDNRNLHPKNLSISELKKSFYADPVRKDTLYRPAACLTLALNYYIGGEEVFGYHMVNVSIHLITAFFLYLLVHLTLRLPSLEEKYGKDAYLIALLTAALWATHPVQTQAVNYIVQRMTSMAAMFCVISLYFYAKGRLGTGSKKPFYFALCLISAILAFCSKENTATLLPIIIIYEVFFFQETDWKRCIKSIRSYLPPLIVLTILELFWLMSQIGFEISYKHRDFSLWERVFTQFRVIIHYLTLLIYPSSSRLNLDYDFPISHSLFDPPTTFFSMMVIIGLIIWSLYTAKKKPLISFSILWFFINLVIESSILPLEMVFEHRLYLPSMGFFVLIAIAFIKAINYFRFRARVRYILALAMCMLLFLQALGTHTRNFVWKDDFTLWTDCVKKSPRKARPHNNLGTAYIEKGMLDESIDEYKKSIALNPNYYMAHSNLGEAYIKKGMLDEAIDECKKSITLNPNYYMAHSNLAAAYIEKGMLDEAIDECKKSITLNPNDYMAYSNLGVAYEREGMLDEAIDAHKKSIALKPNDYMVHSNLAAAYIEKGMLDEAIDEYKKALAINPKLALVHGNLAMAYYYKGDYGEAIRHCDLATKLGAKVDPQFLRLLLESYR